MYASEIIEDALLESGMSFVEAQLLIARFLDEEAQAWCEAGAED